MRELARASGVTPFSLITLKNIETMYAMLTADGAGCEKAMREGLDDRARHRRAHLDLPAAGLRLRRRARLGQPQPGRRRSRASSPARTASAGRFNLCLYHHFQAWEAMLRKDLMTALQQEKAALRMAIEVGCPLFEVLCRLALAEILAECGDERKCVAHLQRCAASCAASTTVTWSSPAWSASRRSRSRTAASATGADRAAPRPGSSAASTATRISSGGGRRRWRACSRHALEAGIEPDYVRSLIKRRAPGAGAAALARRRLAVGLPRADLRRLSPVAPRRASRRRGRTAGKAKKRPLELLKLLIAYGGEQVSESRVTDALWPRIDGDSAHRSFTSTLHRLRKLLGEDRAVTLHEGRLSLDRRYFWLDTWAFEQLAADLEAAGDAQSVEKLVERLLALYRGSFMADDGRRLDDPGARAPARPSARARARLPHWQEQGEEERARSWSRNALKLMPILAEAALRNR